MNDDLSNHDYKIESMTCPVCESDDAKVITHILDIPYYEDYASITISCRACGYRTTDFMNLQIKDPTIMSYLIDDPSDYTTKVVRSREGIVIISELGLRIEPTGDGSTWIRNIEGILEDIRTKLQISLNQSESEEEQEDVEGRIAILEQLLNFEMPFSIEIEDPSGNSLILPAHADKLKITTYEPQESQE